MDKSYKFNNAIGAFTENKIENLPSMTMDKLGFGDVEFKDVQINSDEVKELLKTIGVNLPTP